MQEMMNSVSAIATAVAAFIAIFAYLKSINDSRKRVEEEKAVAIKSLVREIVNEARDIKNQCDYGIYLYYVVNSLENHFIDQLQKLSTKGAKAFLADKAKVGKLVFSFTSTLPESYDIGRRSLQLLSYSRKMQGGFYVISSCIRLLDRIISKSYSTMSIYELLVADDDLLGIADKFKNEGSSNVDELDDYFVQILNAMASVYLVRDKHRIESVIMLLEQILSLVDDMGAQDVIKETSRRILPDADTITQDLRNFLEKTGIAKNRTERDFLLTLVDRIEVEVNMSPDEVRQKLRELKNPSMARAT